MGFELVKSMLFTWTFHLVTLVADVLQFSHMWVVKKH